MPLAAGRLDAASSDRIDAPASGKSAASSACATRRTVRLCRVSATSSTTTSDPLSRRFSARRLVCVWTSYKPRFGIHWNGPSPTADRGIPCPEIAADVDGHLGPPREAGTERGPELREQAELRPVADRLAGRKRPKREIESDGCRRDDERFERDVGCETALDPADLRVRPPDRPADIHERQPGVQARDVDFLTGPQQALARSRPGPIQCPLATRHRGTMRKQPLPAAHRRSFAADPLAANWGDVNAGCSYRTWATRHRRDPNVGGSAPPSSCWPGPSLTDSALSALVTNAARSPPRAAGSGAQGLLDPGRQRRRRSRGPPRSARPGPRGRASPSRRPAAAPAGASGRRPAGRRTRSGSGASSAGRGGT